VLPLLLLCCAAAAQVGPAGQAVRHPGGLGGLAAGPHAHTGGGGSTQILTCICWLMCGQQLFPILHSATLQLFHTCLSAYHSRNIPIHHDLLCKQCVCYSTHLAACQVRVCDPVAALLQVKQRTATALTQQGKAPAGGFNGPLLCSTRLRRGRGEVQEAEDSPSEEPRRVSHKGRGLVIVTTKAFAACHEPSIAPAKLCPYSSEFTTWSAPCAKPLANHQHVQLNESSLSDW
jgi:hypothetical protein